MKNKLFLICLIISVIVSSCSDSGEVTVPADDEITAFSYSPNQNMWDSNEGAYFLSVPTSGKGIIKFHEIGTETWDILCSIPSCTHSGPECEAYGGYRWTFFKGYFYSVQRIENELYLIRINPDGSGHTTIGRTPVNNSKYASGKKNIGGFFCFQDGYLINVITETISSDVSSDYLYVMNIETGEVKELLSDYSSDYVHFQYLSAVSGDNNRLLISADLWQKGECSYLEIGITDGVVYQTIPQIDGLAAVFSANETTITYYCRNVGIMSYKIAEGEKVLQKEFDYYYLTLYLYDNYYFGNATVESPLGASKFVVLDSDFNLLCETDMPSSQKSSEDGKSTGVNLMLSSIIGFAGISDGKVWFVNGTGELTHYASVDSLLDGKPDFSPIS